MPAPAAPQRAFDTSIRILECHRCGAPMTVVPTGSHITCGYCDAVHESVPPPPPTPVKTVATGAPAEDRTAWVREQLANPNHDSPFDPDANYLPELAEFEGKRWSPQQFRARPLPAFRAEWKRAVEASRAGASDSDSRYRVYWLADKLAQIHEFLAQAAKLEGDEATRKEELLRWRAVLETGTELLSGTDYEYVLRCELARAAAKTGDVAAARAWMAPLDPEPVSVDLDTEWRLARATVAAAESDGEGILAVLGEDFIGIPLSGARNQRTGAVLRVHGLELLGRTAEATHAYHQAGANIGFAKMWSELSILGYAPKFHARRRKTARWVRLGLVAMIAGGIGIALSRLL